MKREEVLRKAPTYRGFKRIRMKHSSDGCSTSPVCEVPCSLCGAKLERDASAIRKAQKKGGGFRCNGGCKRNT
jgi:hypothetical protein